MNNSEFHDFLIIQKALLSFSDSDQIIILSKIEEMNPSNYLYLSFLILDSAIAKPRLVTQLVEFLCNKIHQFNSLFNIFIDHLFNLANIKDREGINTINFILNQFLQRSIINQQDIIDKLQSNIYFSHILLDNKLILGTTRDIPSDNFLLNINEYSDNDWEKHRFLINKGINPDQIAEIIFNDDVVTLQSIISGQGKDPNTILQPSIYDLLSFNKPINLLEYSALTASLKCFKFLLLNGGKVRKDIDYYAISGGSEEIIHICEQKGIKINTSTGLYLSIKYHHMHLFKWLLEKEPTEKEYQNIMLFSNYEAIDFINEIEYQFHFDSLCKAIQFNQFIIFKAIIERGVTDYFYNNESVIHSACYSKRNEFFNYLFENKEKLHLDFNHSLRNGLTPLHSACISGVIHYISLLLNLLNINATSIEGLAPIHYAIANNHLDVVKLLVEQQANLKLITNKRNTCFHFACHSNNIDMVNYIISVCDTSMIDQMNIDKISKTNAFLYNTIDSCH